MGLMLGIEMVADQATRATLPKTNDLPARVARAAYQRGLMVRVSGPNLILSPPLGDHAGASWTSCAARWKPRSTRWPHR